MFLSLSALFSLTALAAPPLPDHLQAIEAVGVSTLARSPDWRVRLQASAIQAWQTMPDLAEQAWLLEPLTTRAGHPRFSAPDLRDSGVSAVILERLLTTSEPEPVRMALVELLPRVGGDWAEVLVSAYAEEPQPGVRTAMVEVAGRADPAAARQLVALGADDAAPPARAAAMRAAPRVSEGPELEMLILDGLTDRAPTVRSAAARSASWVALPAAAPVLAEMLSDADADVRLYALRALRKFDPARLAPADLDSLAQDPDPRIIREAQRARQP